MRKDLLLTLGMMAAIAAGAAEISPEQALQRALDAATRDASTKSLTLNRKPGQAPKLSYVMNYTQNPAQAAVYVFSTPGIRVLDNATDKDLNSLPGGIYIVVTDKGTYKTTLNR